MDVQQQILQVTKDNALQAYNQADGEGKSLLVNLFGKKHFCSDMTELIDSFHAACDYNNTNPNDPRFTQGTDAGIALEQLAEIVKAANGGRVMKPNEKRYYGWLIHDEAGFRLFGVGYDVSRSRTAGGPRLCCIDEKTARYVYTKFLPYFDRFLNPKQ